ncbi:Detected protein of unknown function [Hibiscus syriacus]|uniref:GTD-binding domain-containing protein n=1 Tax=Hibiscus syriacus TaxID=106335 RepID=A0A6A2Z3W2_HIBSY|nr:uncharacterized protein LOC120152150 [Hibiscus syriacus]XP_039020359.1 uncharacterized protein LOC120152150 [Hibiscus syriacus]KAE8686070.1 Detected protein of unknown function [Hibiscus syriacus]
MVSCAISSWTLTGLVRSFLDLTLAYFLLCGSTLGYFAWKYCDVFGIHLPCLCSGCFGYQNRNLCWHNLLIQWPRRKICSVQNLALNRVPFDLVSFNDRELNSNDVKFGIEVIELGGKVCSTSLSGVRLETVVDNDNGYNTKGKLAMNQKQKPGARTAFGNGKLSPVLLSDSFPPSTVAGVSCSSYSSGGEIRSEIKDNFGSVAEIDESLPDDKNTQTGTDLGETSWHGFGLSSGEEKGSNLTKKSTCINTNEKSVFIGGEADRIRMLEQALEKKKAKLAAVYLELEKERAASASAADETMAMILRLQEDKASIQMEARQYKRMMEEKIAYDDEEMNILNEMLVRREKENHLLERELEAYWLRDKPEECKFSYTLNNEEQQPSIRLGRGEDPLVMVKQAGNTGLSDEKEVGTVDHDDIASQEIATKTVQGIEKTSLAAEEELKKNADFGKPLDCNVQHPMSDVEPAIYDVHVVDDKLDIPENSKESKTPPDSALEHKTSIYKFRRTFSGVSNEMLAIGGEIEGLRERLQIVRGEKVKLTFSSEQWKMVDTHLKHIEDLVNQLRDFQWLKDPVRQASLPPLLTSPKVGSNRRCCRSVSDEIEDGA